MTPAPPIEAAPSGLADVQRRVAALQSIGHPARAGAPTATGTPTFEAMLRSALSARTTTSTPSGSDVAEIAKKYLGVPYRWGGTDPNTGLDCSGLVQLVYRQAGVELPRVAADQAKVGEPVANLAAAKPGDLVFFGSPVDHVGIYMGDGKMLAAPHTGDVVKIEDVGRTPTAIRRVATSASAGIGSTPYGDLFAAAGAKYGVDPTLLAAVAKTESNFDPNAVSPAGARGLMQIMPSTAAGLGVDPMNPAQAIDGAARLLASNLQQFGSVPLAVAAYNAGAGAVQRYNGIPPYAETQNYVQKVLAAANEMGPMTTAVQAPSVPPLANDTTAALAALAALGQTEGNPYGAAIGLDQIGAPSTTADNPYGALASMGVGATGDLSI